MHLYKGIWINKGNMNVFKKSVFLILLKIQCQQPYNVGGICAQCK